MSDENSVNGFPINYGGSGRMGGEGRSPGVSQGDCD